MRHSLYVHTETQLVTVQQENVPIIDDHYFVDLSTKYAAQLLAQGEWKTALMMTLLIPRNYHLQAIRTRKVFEILCS